MSLMFELSVMRCVTSISWLPQLHHHHHLIDPSENLNQWDDFKLRKLHSLCPLRPPSTSCAQPFRARLSEFFRLWAVVMCIQCSSVLAERSMLVREANAEPVKDVGWFCWWAHSIRTGCTARFSDLLEGLSVPTTLMALSKRTVTLLRLTSTDHHSSYTQTLHGSHQDRF